MEEKQNWLTITAVVLAVAGLGIFLYRKANEEQKYFNCDDYKNSTINSLPVRCYKYYKINKD